MSRLPFLVRIERGDAKDLFCPWSGVERVHLLPGAERVGRVSQICQTALSANIAAVQLLDRTAMGTPPVTGYQQNPG